MCTLLVYIDDVTSRLMHLRFVETESTFSYFAATQGYLEAHGKPVAFYSDKHCVFRVNKAGGVETDGMTQFGRALHALNIEIICANSSQAKGRVERANKTLQDRLVKELRLTGISTMEAGNAFLPSFVADYNSRFAKPPANAKDLHRPTSSRETLEDAFTWREERTLADELHTFLTRSRSADLALILGGAVLGLACATQVVATGFGYDSRLGFEGLRWQQIALYWPVAAAYWIFTPLYPVDPRSLTAPSSPSAPASRYPSSSSPRVGDARSFANSGAAPDLFVEVPRHRLHRAFSASRVTLSGIRL